MKTFALALPLLATAIGCSGEADIGVDSDPITCMETATADMAGTIWYDNRSYHFDGAVPSLTRDANGGLSQVSLWSSENPDTQYGNYLRFDYMCGSPQIATYGVVSTLQQQVTCPLEVGGTVLGQIEILPAKEGTLIMDQTQSCVAGRFRVEFDDVTLRNTDTTGGGWSVEASGAVGGWFSIPVPQQ